MALVLAALVLAGCGTTVSPPDASGSGSPTAPASLVSDPASLVDPMARDGDRRGWPLEPSLSSPVPTSPSG